MIKLEGLVRKSERELECVSKRVIDEEFAKKVFEIVDEGKLENKDEDGLVSKSEKELRDISNRVIDGDFTKKYFK